MTHTNMDILEARLYKFFVFRQLSFGRDVLSQSK